MNQGITVTGNFFQPGATVTFSNPGITVNSVTYNSATSLTANISVAATASGTSDVTVNNQDGGTPATLAAAFTINPALTVTSITPNALGQGRSNVNLAIGGTNFLPSAAGPPLGVTFSNPGITVNSVTYNTPTSLTANVTVATTATPGLGSFTVTNNDGAPPVTLANSFTVLASPTVTSVTPNAGPPSGHTTVAITGTNFTGATAVAFGATAALSFVFNSPTSITAVSPPGNGTVDVTVTTPANTSATSLNDLFAFGAPTVTAVTPTDGPLAGGNTVTITGTGFVPGATVAFVGVGAATGVTVVSSTQITATAPATATPKKVDVTVTTSGGTSALNAGDQYSYDPVPTVTSVTPNSGPIVGGNTVTIAGTGFIAGATVNFVGVGNAAGITVVSATQITAIAPAAPAAETVDVRVTTPGGTSPVNPGDQYTYSPRPTVTAVTPNAGPVAGGNTVTVSGTGFLPGTTVAFGGTLPGTNVTVLSPSQLTVTVPAAGSTGVVDVTVTNSAGTSAAVFVDRYSYDATPAVTSVSPNSGPVAGGTSVTITGTGFTVGAPTTVAFGGVGNATNVNVVSTTSITATTPADANSNGGLVDVTVTTPGGTSAINAGDHFTYIALPTVTGVAPNAGPLNTATGVTITGTGFVVGATVTFVGVGNATGITVVSPTKITASTPPSAAAKTVDVTVTTSGGTSLTSSADQYSYDAVPTVTSVNPNAGQVSGGNTVTVNGTGFVAGTTVAFGGTLPGTNVTIISPNQLTVTVPAAGSPGVVDVTVTNVGGTSQTVFVDRYTYAASPAVTGVSPTAGPVAGGTAITITGTGFTVGAPTTVTLTGIGNATNVTVVSTTSITATTPADGNPNGGTVDLTVTTPGGTSPIVAGDHYTYDALPSVTAVTPNAGAINATSNVTITGSGFTLGAPTTVTFIGVGNATNVTVVSTTQITATGPASATQQTVDVTVSTPGGISAVNTGDHYTYEGSPTITTVTPSVGPLAGNVTVTSAGATSRAPVR